MNEQSCSFQLAQQQPRNILQSTLQKASTAAAGTIHCGNHSRLTKIQLNISQLQTYLGPGIVADNLVWWVLKHRVSSCYSSVEEQQREIKYNRRCSSQDGLQGATEAFVVWQPEWIIFNDDVAV